MRNEPKSRVLDKGLWGMSAPMLIDQAVIYTIPLLDMFFLSRISDSAAAAVAKPLDVRYRLASQMLADVRAVVEETAESKAMSKELKRRGFSFVGPTTMFALMEAVGVVDTHLVGSHRRGTSGVWT